MVSRSEAGEGGNEYVSMNGCEIPDKSRQWNLRAGEKNNNNKSGNCVHGQLLLQGQSQGDPRRALSLCC